MTGFPKLACYSWSRGSNGTPLLKLDGTPDLPLLEKFSRYSTVTVGITPWYGVEQPSRPDPLLLLRRFNPRIRILAYELLGVWRLPATFVPQSWDKTFALTWHNAIVRTGGLGSPTGELKSDGTPLHWWVRWENPATEAALTKLLCDLAASRLFDGFFGDYFWATTLSGSDALQRMAHAVKQAGGPGFVVIGNGPMVPQGVVNDADRSADGSMREGFPDRLGHDFEHIRRWRASRPHRTEDWIQAGTGFTSLDTPAAQKAARFAHGTGCLFDCQVSFGPDRDPNVRYHEWFMPEYDGGGRGVGWLGEPMGPAKKFGPIWQRSFGGGHVLVNEGNVPMTEPLPKGLFDIRTGNEMGSVTVGAQDACFLRRAR